MGLTKAQRYNKRLDEIFTTAKQLHQAQNDTVRFMGRNIGEQKGLYCLTWSTADLSRVTDHTTTWYFESYRLAHDKMTELRRNGTQWFDAHTDPTI